MKHVLIPTKLDTVAKTLLEDQGFTVVVDTETPLVELAVKHPETQALIVRSDKVTEAVLDAFSELKLVVRAGAGYNTIDTIHARRLGVDVMNTPGANANAVAEEVLALALAYYRHLVPADISTRQGLWEKKNYMGRELAGKTLGIVGLGNIGQLVAKRASGFDVTLLGFDPAISAEKAAASGVALVGLEELFERSDVVSLHVPETKDTVGMVNSSLLDHMKDGAVIINCARAGIINEADLRAAREAKGLGFCNDVYPEDAPGEKTIADVADVMAPHLGANTFEANENAARRAAEQLVAYARHGITRYVVNKGVPDGLDESYQQLAYHVSLLGRHYLGGAPAVRRIECSFYGDLNQFANWFISPIVAGICPDFDPLLGAESAMDYLQQKGIVLDVLPADDSKSYGESMTVEVFAGDQHIERVSIRGTTAEGNLMISRVNAFNKLYFEFHKHNLFVVYRDRPGVLTRITGACADADINIEDIRAPYDDTKTRSMAILKTNRPVPAETLARIREEIQPEVAFSLDMP